MPEIKYCPTCGSTKLKWFLGLPHFWSIHECRECGYLGALVITNGELAKKIRKKMAR